MFALKNKQTEEVAVALTNLFWMFGFPIEYCTQTMEKSLMSELCRKHKIKQVHGAPRSNTIFLIKDCWKEITAQSKTTS